MYNGYKELQKYKQIEESSKDIWYHKSSQNYTAQNTSEYEFSLTRIFLYTDRISILENTGPRKSVIWHNLRSFIRNLFRYKKYLNLPQGLSIFWVFIYICNFTVFRSNLFSQVLAYLRDWHFKERQSWKGECFPKHQAITA